MFIRKRRQPMRNKALLSFVLLMALSACSALAAAGQPAAAATQPATSDNGTSTGQRIGNIISAVVSTAFPAVSSIIHAIWPEGGTQGKKPAQVTDALQPLKQSSTQSLGQKASELQSAAANLVVLRSFVTECGFASVQISKMQTYLSGKNLADPATPDDKSRLGDLWTPTQTRLNTLTTQTVNDSINSMTDDFLKSVLTDVQTAITDNSANVATQIKDGRLQDLSSSLAQLAPKINGISPLTGILIGDLASSLKAAASNLSGQGGPPESEQQKSEAERDQSSNQTLIKQIYNVEAQ